MQIVVPLDGTLRAETVLHPLKVLARRVAEPSTMTLVLVQSAAADTAHAQPYLATIKASDDLAHLTVQTRSLAGDPAERICEVAKEQGADLILMASHMAMLDPLTGGSVAETVARCANVPTLILRPEGFAFPDLPRYTSLTIAILMAMPLADATALQPCVRLAQLFDADLLLVGEHTTRRGEDAVRYEVLTTVARQIERVGIAVARSMTPAPITNQVAALLHTHQIAIIALPLGMAGADIAARDMLQDITAPTLLFHT